MPTLSPTKWIFLASQSLELNSKFYSFVLTKLLNIVVE